MGILDQNLPLSRAKRLIDDKTYSDRAATAAKRSRQNQTVGERHLWEELRKLKLNIRRQAPIGNYVADFACHGAKLIIEVDGYYHGLEDRRARDAARDAWFAARGYRVLRVSDRDAHNQPERIAQRVAELITTLPPQRGKGRVGGVGSDSHEDSQGGVGALPAFSGDALPTPPTPTLPPSRGKGGLKDQLLRILADVPDPEIPAISIVDLGIVRDVVDGAVIITPTYTGCPATLAIEAMIRAALDAAGFGHVAIRTVIDPPWSTDWITDAGREKLRAYGIAPPPHSSSLRGPDLVACPQCGSTETEEVSRFGSTPCKALWRCRACAEPFDRFKCH
jgi:ring-1,2-phenylacetyl-CoA epoxidase subunit PaaD